MLARVKNDAVLPCGWNTCAAPLHRSARLYWFRRVLWPLSPSLYTAMPKILFNQGRAGVRSIDRAASAIDL